jgi:hypothetical protein
MPCSSRYKRRCYVYSTLGTFLSTSQSGQLKENPRTTKIVLKLPIVVMKLKDGPGARTK